MKPSRSERREARSKSYGGKNRSKRRNCTRRPDNINIMSLTPPPMAEIKRIPIIPRNSAQKNYLNSLNVYSQVFGVGPAGTGKTYLSVAVSVRKIIDGHADRLIISRPMVSSSKDEKLGYLTGGLEEKFGPWVVPIIDVVEREIGKSMCDYWIKSGKIVFCPFEFMRGRTFGARTIVILDEAQNTTPRQIKLFLTRQGEASVIISGDLDPDQCDLEGPNGLETAIKMVERYNIPASVCTFTEDDVVRSPLCKAWVKAFSEEKVRKLWHSPALALTSGT